MKYLGLPVLLVAIAGCSLQKTKDEPPATIERQPRDVQVAPSSQQTEYSLSEVVELLQRGREQQAEVALKALLKKSPKHPIYIDLLKQIQLSPQQYFNHNATTKYRVRSGDSLARIAKQQIGNEMAFYALAKLNRIRSARLIAVGQELKIPVLGQQQAVTQVKTKPAKQTTQLPESILQQITQMYKASNSSSLLNLYHKWHKQLDSIETKEPQLREAKSWLFEAVHEQAVSLYRQQQLEQAIGLWQQLLDIDANFEAGQVYLLRAKSLLERLEKIN